MYVQSALWWVFRWTTPGWIPQTWQGSSIVSRHLIINSSAWIGLGMIHAELRILKIWELKIHSWIPMSERDSVFKSEWNVNTNNVVALNDRTIRKLPMLCEFYAGQFRTSLTNHLLLAGGMAPTINNVDDGTTEMAPFRKTLQVPNRHSSVKRKMELGCEHSSQVVKILYCAAFISTLFMAAIIMCIASVVRLSHVFNNDSIFRLLPNFEMKTCALSVWGTSYNGLWFLSPSFHKLIQFHSQVEVHCFLYKALWYLFMENIKGESSSVALRAVLTLVKCSLLITISFSLEVERLEIWLHLLEPGAVLILVQFLSCMFCGSLMGP